MLRPWETIINFLPDRAGIPLYQQLAEVIEKEIEKGRLQPDTALPGSRSLAKHLSLDRNTVVMAYQRLIAQGFLYSLEKKGTFVAKPSGARGNTCSKAKQPLPFGPLGSKKHVLRFDDGLPDPQLAPVKEITRAYKRIAYQKMRLKKPEYDNSLIDEELKNEIWKMLLQNRGMHLMPEELCVIKGTQMALYLVTQTLFEKDDWIVVENPGNPIPWSIFRTSGIHLVTVGVDGTGMDMEELEEVCRHHSIKAVYISTLCQYPTTVTLSAGNRGTLIELSLKYNFYIIETDFDHEYCFCETALLPLAAESSERIIYIGTLSRMTASLFRIAFVTGPVKFIQSLEQLRSTVDPYGDPLLKQAITELIQEGIIGQYQRSALKKYNQKRVAMSRLLDNYLFGKITYHVPDCGLSYWIEFNDLPDTSSLSEKLEKRNVIVPSPDQFDFYGKAIHRLKLGFGSITIAELEKGINVITNVLKTCCLLVFQFHVMIAGI